MPDDDQRQTPQQWIVWAAIVSLGGGSGLGSFLGARGVDDQPSERLARIESQLSAQQASLADVRGDMRELQEQRVECDSRTSNLRWRVEQCERRLNEGPR